MMTPSKNCAPSWKTTQPPLREAHRDAFWAEFEDDSGNTVRTVRVRITAQGLKAFGLAPAALEQKGEHTEHVLRAILETYINKYGIPETEIEDEDLGPNLTALKRQFASNP